MKGINDIIKFSLVYHYELYPDLSGYYNVYTLTLFFKNKTSVYVYKEQNSGTVEKDDRIEKDTILQSVDGAKTYKLKDLPSIPSTEKGVVWVDENNFLRLS